MLIVKTNLYKILGSKNIQGFWSLGLIGMKFLLGQNHSHIPNTGEEQALGL